MWIYIVICCALQKASAIRLVDIQVPERVPAGEGVELTCSYDLEGDKLYNIKWYLDGVEFFRFVPSDVPSRYFFPVKGIQVDIEKSVNGSVFIQDVKMNTSGTYRCEISADAPSFQTLLAERMMAVEEAEEIPTNSGSILEAYSKNLILFLFCVLCSAHLANSTKCATNATHDKLRAEFCAAQDFEYKKEHDDISSGILQDKSLNCNNEARTMSTFDVGSEYFDW